MDVTIIVPAYNEEQNVALFYKTMKKMMDTQKGINFEVVIVDDGSDDNTHNKLREINDSRLHILRLERHRGKCYALFKGIEGSRGDIIANLDIDLQNEPMDLPQMIGMLGEGCDMVCGWRVKRKDGFAKLVSTRVGNLFNNMLTGAGLHDNTCPVKVYKKACVSNLRYFRNFHRFMPIMAKKQGFILKEFQVRHYPRRFGKSKYGIHNRIFGNLATILTIKTNHKRLLK